MPRSTLPRTAARRAALCAALFAALAGSAGARTLEIEIEPIIILNCKERIDYRVETARLLAQTQTLNPSARSDAGAGSGGRLIEARLPAPSIDPARSGTTVEIDVTDSCTVRGLGRGEGFLVEVRPAANAILRNETGGGVLRVQDVKGRAAGSGAFARNFSISQRSIRLEREIGIDVRLRLDLREAALNGRYSSPADGVFAIEVTAP